MAEYEQLQLPLVFPTETNLQITLRRDDVVVFSHPVPGDRSVAERLREVYVDCWPSIAPSFPELGKVIWDVAPRATGWYGLEPDSGGAHTLLIRIEPAQEPSS